VTSAIYRELHFYSKFFFKHQVNKLFKNKLFKILHYWVTVWIRIFDSLECFGRMFCQTYGRTSADLGAKVQFKITAQTAVLYERIEHFFKNPSY
jgi:hypothetical protein